MQETLISFETAKLAKEKGFDWKVIYGYNTLQKIEDIVNTDYAPDLKYQYSNINQYNISDKEKETESDWERWLIYSAPTQSFLQKWLREIHDMHIHITLNQFGYGYMYAIMKIKPAECIVYLQGGAAHKLLVYEDALEEGLQRMLNLIKC
jgi:hypothetical protein